MESIKNSEFYRVFPQTCPTKKDRKISVCCEDNSAFAF